MHLLFFHRSPESIAPTISGSWVHCQGPADSSFSSLSALRYRLSVTKLGVGCGLRMRGSHLHHVAYYTLNMGLKCNMAQKVELAFNVHLKVIFRERITHICNMESSHLGVFIYKQCCSIFSWRSYHSIMTLSLAMVLACSWDLPTFASYQVSIAAHFLLYLCSRIHWTFQGSLFITQYFLLL